MSRYKHTFKLTDEDFKSIKYKMLSWANQFSISVYLDNNQYHHLSYHRFECLVALNPVDTLPFDRSINALSDVSDWHSRNSDWLLGHICYDYKNELHPYLSSRQPSHFLFPNIYFFCPEVVCYIPHGTQQLVIESLQQSPQWVYQQILTQEPFFATDLPQINFSKKMLKDEYLRKINRLREHIKEGDCYEINFCNEGYAENVIIEPVNVFHQLNKSSPAPFAAYYRFQDQYMMGSSPERYLYKLGKKIISQPIKGTAKRNFDSELDNKLKQSLHESVKERAENVMIVDLTRNDLSRSCETGSVQVEELFGIYSFPTVHQMISTISGKLDSCSSLMDSVLYSFPMGSMTGAPKVKVMELINAYESSKRELFSGSIGYITPSGDFDFNVVIRSLFYNASTAYLSYQTGGAITFDSDAHLEWEETILKASGMEKIFQKH